ncbi:hypothetical protein ABZZ74_23960 [Streptomyces sp. NPDC006476]|uniref:hypothetical protein n=1 Tax=Streptomyces sp. NPDC006476 TaxID=3157175 RepID=UPI0033A6DD8D
MPSSRRPGPVGDRHSRGSARLAAGCALAFCAMTMLGDWDADTLSTPRALLRGRLHGPAPAPRDRGPRLAGRTRHLRRRLVHGRTDRRYGITAAPPPAWSCATPVAAGSNSTPAS